MKKISDFLKKDKYLIGHDEWCTLPDLHLPAIKAKVDTGAKTSAIHAFNIKVIKKKSVPYVRFDVHPLQADNDTIISCCRPVIDRRYVMSSNGSKEHRYVIATRIKIGHLMWVIQVTLSNRDPLRYRMLLGREALGNQFLIDPSLSCNQGRMNKRAVRTLYK